MEIYVDDMLVKSQSIRTHINDLEEVLAILQKYKMKLNPAKCVFGITSRKFLGFMVSNQGIKANLEKIKTVQEMISPRTTKEV